MRYLVLFLVISIAAMADSRKQHIVKPGETLSEIAQFYFPISIYRQNGSLINIVNLNTSVNNPDLIFPNQIIYLEAKKNEEVSNKTKKLKNPRKKVKKVEIWSKFGISYLSLESTLLKTQNVAYIYSDLTPSLEAGIDYNVTKYIESFLSIEFQYASFNISNNKILNSSKAIQSSLHLGLSKEMKKSKIQVEYQLLDSYFLRSIDRTHLKVENSLTSFVNFDFDRYIFNNEDFKLSAGVKFGLLVPIKSSDYYYTDGNRWNIHLAHHFNHFQNKYMVKFIYDKKRLETQMVKQTTTEISINLQRDF
jgi:hypothetical protein